MDAVGKILLIGCGRMGGAMARAWAPGHDVHVHDPPAGDIPPGTIRAAELSPEGLPMPLTVVVAVKPQVLGEVLPLVVPFAQAGCLILSVVAGATLAHFESALGPAARVIRAMPNTPGAIGRGVTAAIGAPSVTPADQARAGDMLAALGETLWVREERDMDVVTAVSGSGPAYFFRFAEALARAGGACGLDPVSAMTLARATFTGAAALAEAEDEPLEMLRAMVTSPGGTTAAALHELDRGGAIDRLVEQAVRSAAARSRELSA